MDGEAQCLLKFIVSSSIAHPAVSLPEIIISKWNETIILAPVTCSYINGILSQKGEKNER